jgi:hypothetical protein
MAMNGLKSCTFAILFLITCFGVVRSQAPSQSLELIHAANAASDLSKIEPYRLDAEVIVNNGHGGETRGRLTIFKAHEKSRAELEWANYKELTVVLGNSLYVVRNAPGPPRELHGLPDVRRLWRILVSPQDKVSQPFIVDFQDMKANCVSVEAGNEISRDISRYCFDPSTKALIEKAWAKTQGTCHWGNIVPRLPSDRWPVLSSYNTPVFEEKAGQRSRNSKYPSRSGPA